MDNSDTRSVKIIIDEPAQIDSFDGGGHKRSAMTLADSIEQLSDRDGAIGLEGSWGSGKSTVINLASQFLKDRKTSRYKFSVFTFDLWAHQSDDFRRAFIEEFVSWCNSEEHLDLDTTEKAQEIIRDKVRTVKIENNKHYSAFGLIFILIFPILPIIYTWLSPLSFNLKSNNTITEYAHIIGTGLIIGVYALFLLRFLLIHISKFRSWVLLSDWSKSTSQAVSIFSRDVEHQTTTQNIRESDPTTIEFHEIFRGLLSKIQKGSTRIVLVLDNIDRLPPETVLSVWPEVRSLFSVGATKKNLENTFITAVVPYDKPVIVDAFSDTVDSLNRPQNDLVEKTFSRVLRVAPPVATDWKKFLYNSFDYAFGGEIKDETKTRLFQVLRHSFQEQRIHPSPRRIIDYVNQIGVLWTEWGDRIPLEAMAIYVLHREKFENDPNALRDSSSIDDRYIRITNLPDWQRYIAALSFNVDPDLANQVFLGLPIAHAIAEPKADELIKLSVLDGFNDVLPEVLAENLADWAKTDPEIISNVALNIEAINIDNDISRTCWEDLGNQITNLVDVDIENLAALSGLFKILEHQEADICLRGAYALQRIASNSPGNTPNDEIVEGEKWVAVVRKIHSVIEQNVDAKSASIFLGETDIRDNPNFCLSVAYNCAQFGAFRYTDLRTHTSIAQISETFCEWISINPEQSLIILREIGSLFSIEDKAAFTKQIIELLRKDDIKNEDDRTALLEILVDLFQSSNGADEIIRLVHNAVQDGTLLWHSNVAFQDENFQALAASEWLNVNHQQALSTPNIPDQHPQLGQMTAIRNWHTEFVGASEMTANIVDALASYVARFNQFTDWSEVAFKDSSGSRLTQEVLKVVIKEGKYNELVVSSTISNYDRYIDIIGDEAKSGFLEKLSDWSGHLEEALRPEMILQIPSSFIYDVSSLASRTGLKKALTIIDSYLKQLRTEDWEDSIEKEDDRVRLLIARRKTGKISLPVDSFRPALQSHALRLLSKETVPKISTSDWADLVGGLKPNSRHILAQDIFNKLPSITVTNEGAADFVRFYPTVANEIPITNNPDMAIDQFISKILFSVMEETCSLVRNRKSEIRECLKNASEISANGFEEAVQSLEERTDESAREWAQEIREMFGLEQQKSPETETASPE